jgi:hypothetical protein
MRKKPYKLIAVVSIFDNALMEVRGKRGPVFPFQQEIQTAVQKEVGIKRPKHKENHEEERTYSCPDEWRNIARSVDSRECKGCHTHQDQKGQDYTVKQEKNMRKLHSNRPVCKNIFYRNYKRL